MNILKVLNHSGKALCALALLLCSSVVMATTVEKRIKVDFTDFASAKTVTAVFVKATKGEPIAVNSAMKPYAAASSFSSDVVKVDVDAGQTTVEVPLLLMTDLSEGVVITLMCSDGSYTTNDYSDPISMQDGTVHEYKFEATGGVKANNWMATIPSKVKFNMLTLPGAHDAATSGVTGTFATTSKTQNLTIEEQLAAGVRALDLRPRYTASNEEDIQLDNLEIYHGSTATGVKWKDAMDAILEFLRNNPTETVFINMQKEDASGRNDYSSTWRTSIRTYLENHKDQVLQQITTYTALGDCRGKIVVVSHNPYGDESNNWATVYGGLTASWEDNGASFNTTINYTNSNVICDATICDDYKSYTNSDKQASIKKNLDAANGDISTRWYYTFMNVGYVLFVSNISNKAAAHNAYLYNLLQNNTYTSRLGIVFYDFCGSTSHTADLLPALIQHNYKYLYSSETEDEEICSGSFASGDYYLYNVEAKKYMLFGANWGTRATLVEDAGTTVSLDAGYRYMLSFPEITKLTKGLFLNGNNIPFCDGNPVEFDINETDEKGVYTISTNGLYICCKEDYSAEPSPLETTSDAKSKLARWRLVTRQERIDALAEASADNPVDATFYINGAEIEQYFNNAAAWQGRTPRFDGRVDNNSGNLEATGYAAEYYGEANVESYQTLEGLPAGKYRVSCYGFYRDGGYTEAYEKHINGSEKIQAFLFANDETTPLSSIMEGAVNNGNDGGANVGGSLWIPNDMAQAVLYFFRGRYPAVSVDVTINEGETLTLGIRKEDGTENKWTLWDRFRLKYLGPDTDNVSIGEAEYTAYVTPFDADFTLTEGLQAYKVTDANTESATLEEIDTAPKGTAVILNAAPNEEEGYTIRQAKEGVPAMQGNIFMPGGTPEAVGNGENIYALGYKSQRVGFYLVANNLPVPANKGYLQIDGNPADVKAFIPFGDDATGIEAPASEEGNGEPTVIYNLAGQRVTNPTAGIYIVNGKKVLISK